MSDDSFLLRLPDDWHVHVRQEVMTHRVITHTARFFGRTLIMPNTTPPIATGDDANRYHNQILTIWEGKLRRNDPAPNCFEPIMSIKLLDYTTPAMIRDASRQGVRVAKAYLRGTTHNSDDGITGFESENMRQVLRTMEEVGMILSLHGEIPTCFVLDREKEFLPTLEWLAQEYPDLKIVLEHITTREAVNAVMRLGPNVAATITAHHLAITLNDVIGKLIQPHNFCMPVAKREDDRQALWDAITWAFNTGSCKFFFGSDSAPHDPKNKECAAGCAGVYTAPIRLPLLATLFEREFGRRGNMDWQPALQWFTSEAGARFYGLEESRYYVKLVKRPFLVLSDYEGIIPFMAGRMLDWDVEPELIS